MKSKIKCFVLVLMLLFSSQYLPAEQQTFYTPGQCAVYLMNGTVFVDVINFMSTRSSRLGFHRYGKIKIPNVWMMNFNNKQWNFPGERQSLAPSMDTIFLRNGRILHDRVVTFSTRMKVFRFVHSSPIHMNEIKRIYFCCNKLPASYQALLQQGQNNNQNRPRPPRQSSYYTFVTDGRVINSSVTYFNNLKTGFQNGLELNTKDIVLINFIDNQYYEPPRDAGAAFPGHRCHCLTKRPAGLQELQRF